MRTLIVTEFISLDGVVDSPGGGEHPHAGWTFKDVAFDEAAYEIKGRETARTQRAAARARVSYDEFAPVWPSMEEFATYNAMPKYVVSSHAQRPGVEQHLGAALPRRGGRAQGRPRAARSVHGSATLAQDLAAAGLVDRYHLLVFPVRARQRQEALRPEGADKTEAGTGRARGLRQRRSQLAVYDVVR